MYAYKEARAIWASQHGTHACARNVRPAYTLLYEACNMHPFYTVHTCPLCLQAGGGVSQVAMACLGAKVVVEDCHFSSSGKGSTCINVISDAAVFVNDSLLEAQHGACCAVAGDKGRLCMRGSTLVGDGGGTTWGMIGAAGEVNLVGWVWGLDGAVGDGGALSESHVHWAMGEGEEGASSPLLRVGGGRGKGAQWHTPLTQLCS